MRGYCQTGVFGWFVWRRNPGEFFDDSGPGFDIKTFLVALGTDFRRAINMDFQKLPIVKERLELLAILPI
jgi:hypothetical protein